MISIIVCSRNKRFPSLFEQNIRQTIGDTGFEIVWIDNSNNQYNIFSAYNRGVELAHCDYLCFMHEDVKFCSNNWGKIVEDSLQDRQVGMLGVIGTHYLSRYSTYWISNITSGRILQGFERDGKHCVQEWNLNRNPLLGNKVVAIDGLWMCCRKDMFNGIIRFDDETFKGFHFYDLDISMQTISKGYEIILTDKVLLEHTSKSFYNHAFLDSCMAFHKKWNKQLPVQSQDIPEDEMEKFELETVRISCRDSVNVSNYEREFKKKSYRFYVKVLNTLVRLKHFLAD